MDLKLEWVSANAQASTTSRCKAVSAIWATSGNSLRTCRLRASVMTRGLRYGIAGVGFFGMNSSLIDSTLISNLRNLRRLDHLPPLGDLGLDVGAEFGRRDAGRFE